ncbi:MAG TPA: type IV secretion system DNA-binding domain-containing protein, partial [Chloroflexota bacterium]|nr:type IV secretion system DNA-binding domain-containing protein [Chloroflexota bacterium]
MTLLEAVAPCYPETVAVIGAGGSGKTTIVEQLAREAEAAGKRVLVGDAPEGEFDLALIEVRQQPLPVKA